MTKEVINELKKYTAGKKNTEKVEISVLALNRLIFALEEQEPILDKIRAEIDEKQYDFMADGDYNEGIRFGLMLAYQIIDKYRAESEGKE